MSLKNFFWEYIHRIWGRLIGLTFFLPLIFIWFKGGFNSKEKRLILIISFRFSGLHGMVYG